MTLGRIFLGAIQTIPIRTILSCLLLTGLGCSGIQRYEGGYIFVPPPEGDAVEQQVERLFRDRTGIWMGMPRGVAEDILLGRHGADTARQPTSGGVTTFRAPGGGYVYLLHHTGPSGTATTLVCGLQLRGVGDSPPPLVTPADVRSLLSGDSYRRTERRVVSVTDREVLFLDREHCGRRDPGPPGTPP